ATSPRWPRWRSSSRISRRSGAASRDLFQVKERDDDLQDDEHNHRPLQQHQAAIAGDVQDQLQRLLDAAQLQLQRLVAVDQVELGAKLVVDAIHARVVPGLVGLVEKVQDGEHLVAGADGGADEL